MHNRFKQMGFTVTELMVGLSLIAILAGVGAPNLNNWMDNYRVKGEARELYSELQLLKARAIKERKRYDIMYSTDGYEWSAYYIIECLTELCWETGNYGTDWEWLKWKYVSWESHNKVVFRHPNPSYWPVENSIIAFNPNGMTNAIGFVYIANGRNTKYYRVGMPSRAGAIVVERWSGSAWH